MQVVYISEEGKSKVSKLVVSAWVTLDGVFDSETMDQWFAPYDSVERQNYIRDGILAADAFLLGRTTYEMLAPYWSSMKNNEMGVAAKLNAGPKYVVSSKKKNAEWNNSTIVRKNVMEEVAALKEKSGHEIQIEGSATLVQSLAEAGLIDEYRFLVHPIVMGSGRRFFKDGMHTGGLKLVQTRTLDLGVVLLCYKPLRVA